MCKQKNPTYLETTCFYGVGKTGEPLEKAFVLQKEKLRPRDPEGHDESKVCGANAAGTCPCAGQPPPCVWTLCPLLTPASCWTMNLTVWFPWHRAAGCGLWRWSDTKGGCPLAGGVYIPCLDLNPWSSSAPHACAWPCVPNTGISSGSHIQHTLR